jgi:hypothetical protein
VDESAGRWLGASVAGWIGHPPTMGRNLCSSHTVRRVYMTEQSDETVVLRADESSVLVHRSPLDPVPGVDASARLGAGRPVRVDVRFGRLPSRADLDRDDGEVVLVAPAESGSFGDVPVYTVAGPDDLTGYGVALTRVVDDHDAPLYVEVDSLTSLLQHASLDRAFRFAHVLSGRVDRERAVLVASIDPGAHDEQTVATLTQPFDVTVTGEEGARRIRRRG